MDKFFSLQDIDSSEKYVATFGIFDGMHKGHTEIFRKMNEISINKNLKMLVFLLEKSSYSSQNADNQKYITSLHEKIELLDNKYNIVVIPFLEQNYLNAFYRFLKENVSNNNLINTIVVGQNIIENSAETIKSLEEISSEFNINIETIPVSKYNGRSISSNLIKELISNGEIKKANTLLGINYSLEGQVIGGNQLGRTINFPTANINIEDHNKLMPKFGVYATVVEIDKVLYLSMTYIGFKSNSKATKPSVEVNIFDFNSSIYGKNIRLFFYDRIRDDMHFNNLEELKTQLQIDKIQTEEVLKNFDLIFYDK